MYAYNLGTNIAGLENMAQVINQQLGQLQLAASQLHGHLSTANGLVPLAFSRPRLLSDADAVSKLIKEIDNWMYGMPKNIRFISDDLARFTEDFRQLNNRLTAKANELATKTNELREAEIRFKHELSAAQQQIIPTPPISFYKEVEASGELVVNRNFTFQSGKISVEYALGDPITLAEIAAIHRSPECALFSQVEFSVTGFEADWSWDKHGRGIYEVRKVVLKDDENLEPYQAECDRIRRAHVGKDKISDCMYCEEHMASISKRTRDFTNQQTNFERIYASYDPI